MDTHAAVAVVGLVNQALSSVKTAVDLSKKTSDMELKSQVNDVLDKISELKATVHELADENRSLREQLNQKASVKRTSEFGYYFADGDPDPFCPKCKEGSEKLIHLTKALPHSGGIFRECFECSQRFWEKPMKTQPYPRMIDRGRGRQE